MRISIKADYARAAQAFMRAPSAISDELRGGTKKSIALIRTEAQQNHRFKTRSGQLERSIQQSVVSSGLSGKAYLEKGIAVYGPRIHTGFGKWAPDQFLYKASKKMNPEISKVMDMAFEKAFKRARLK